MKNQIQSRYVVVFVCSMAMLVLVFGALVYSVGRQARQAELESRIAIAELGYEFGKHGKSYGDLTNAVTRIFNK